MAFFARISDPRIGGTYMTFLNTMSNIGGQVMKYNLGYHTILRSTFSGSRVSLFVPGPTILCAASSCPHLTVGTSALPSCAFLWCLSGLAQPVCGFWRRLPLQTAPVVMVCSRKIVAYLKIYANIEFTSIDYHGVHLGTQ